MLGVAKRIETPLLIVVLVCGSAAAFLGGRWLFAAKTAPPEELVEVIVAKKDLPVGTVLNDKEIESGISHINFPKSAFPENAINDLDQLKGKRLNRTIKVGNWFSEGDVGPDAIRLKCPESLVEYFVRHDQVKAGGYLLQAGDPVDVLDTFSEPTGKARSRRMMRHRLVLECREGHRLDKRPLGTLIAVTPEQALFLTLAEERGELRLILRSDPEID